MDVFIIALGLALLLSCFLDVRVKEPHRRFSFGLVRVLLFLPLLAGVYFFSFTHFHHQSVAPLFFAENLFSLVWLLMAYRLHDAHLTDPPSSQVVKAAFLTAGTLVVGACGYWLFSPPTVEMAGNSLLFPRYGPLSLSAVFMLLAMFFMVWRLDTFWRALAQKERWQHKYLVIGFLIVCGCLFWCASYRILFRQLVGDHFLILAILILISWFFILYAVVRHRLLNRRLFISRKIVYSAVAPIIFAGYLLILAVASLVIKTFGWSLPHVFEWLLIILGLLFVLSLVFSGKVRSSVKYFISTHFYVNKYEYRDEWLAFSTLLRGTLTEHDVVDALRHILSESLYTRKILIWLGDMEKGFRLITGAKDDNRRADTFFPGDSPLAVYLQHEQYFYLAKPIDTPAWQHVQSETERFFLRNGVVLMMPMAIAGQCVGLIGLGPEYTGGRYGQDDFDLLAALGSQAASAILAARTAELLAQTRETSAWDSLSAFVLHDIKNAATMLKLVNENAPAHIHKPEFQQDMLESVDDALRRMYNVQARLNSLKGATTPSLQSLKIGQLVSDCCHSLASKIPDIAIDVQYRQNPTVSTDPDLVAQVLENIIINALEAGGPGTRVQVTVSNTDHQAVQLEIADSGPGIPADLLPDRLFNPFVTTKPDGNGVGLWQVKRLVESLGGAIGAENIEEGGAKFLVRFPIGAYTYT